jgi:hypothetical protein
VGDQGAGGGGGLSSPVGPTDGGTGIVTYAQGDILIASAIDTLAKLPKGAAKTLLAMNAAGTLPEWLAAIAEAQGGTGQTTYAQGDILYASAADTLARLAKGTASQQIRMNAGATAPEWFTPAAGGGGHYADSAIYAHVTGPTTSGGSAGAGVFQTRTLNTTRKAPTGSNISRTGSVITLKKGKIYEVEGYSVGYLVGNHQAHFWQTSGTPAPAIEGSAEKSGNGNQTSNKSIFKGEVDLSAAGSDATYIINHGTRTAVATFGLGPASSQYLGAGTYSNCYAAVTIRERV